MPNAMLISLSKRAGIPLSKAEKSWEKAKGLAAQQLDTSVSEVPSLPEDKQNQFWAYTTAITKKMVFAGDDNFTLEYHKELNPKLWDKKGKLNPEVHQHLLQIANKFKQEAKIPEDAIKDLYISGGNANYNYTPQSDIDLHWVVDFGKLPFRTSDAAKDYFMDKKDLWKEKFPTLSVEGYQVEPFAQSNYESPKIDQGVYSVLQDKWIKKPPYLDINYAKDDPFLLPKVESWERHINHLISLNTPYESMEAIKDKLNKLDADSINKEGEFSFDRLLYKELRNRGVLQKLKDYIHEKEALQLSLKDSKEESSVAPKPPKPYRPPTIKTPLAFKAPAPKPQEIKPPKVESVKPAKPIKLAKPSPVPNPTLQENAILSSYLTKEFLDTLKRPEIEEAKEDKLFSHKEHEYLHDHLVDHANYEPDYEASNHHVVLTKHYYPDEVHQVMIGKTHGKGVHYTKYSDKNDTFHEKSFGHGHPYHKVVEHIAKHKGYLDRPFPEDHKEESSGPTSSSGHLIKTNNDGSRRFHYGKTLTHLVRCNSSDPKEVVSRFKKKFPHFTKVKYHSYYGPVGSAYRNTPYLGKMEIGSLPLPKIPLQIVGENIEPLDNNCEETASGGVSYEIPQNYTNGTINKDGYIKGETKAQPGSGARGKSLTPEEQEVLDIAMGRAPSQKLVLEKFRQTDKELSSDAEKEMHSYAALHHTRERSKASPGSPLHKFHSALQSYHLSARNGVLDHKTADLSRNGHNAAKHYHSLKAQQLEKGGGSEKAVQHHYNLVYHHAQAVNPSSNKVVPIPTSVPPEDKPKKSTTPKEKGLTLAAHLKKADLHRSMSHLSTKMGDKESSAHHSKMHKMHWEAAKSKAKTPTEFKASLKVSRANHRDLIGQHAQEAKARAASARKGVVRASDIIERYVMLDRELAAGPKIVKNSKGTFHYNDQNQLHRVDGPAVERANGDKEYWVKVKKVAAPKKSTVKASFLKDNIMLDREESAVQGAKDYAWHTYDHNHATNLTKKIDNGEIKHRLEKGTKFGISTIKSGKDKGKHKVVVGSSFTHPHILPANKAGVLLRRSKPTNAYIVKNSYGTFHYKDKDKLHREDGPAVERANGYKAWYKNGNLHRVGGPAIERVNGDKVWCQNDKLHRVDGPAVERANGDKAWYQNGKLHRKDGPAIEKANGDKEYWVEGKKVAVPKK